MESFKASSEDIGIIKESISINSFLKEHHLEGDVGNFGPENLLTENKIREEKEKHRKRDAFYEKFSIQAILKFILKSGNFEINNDGIIEMVSNERINLPDGYGFKGGAARTILRKNLGLKYHEPRDYDLVRIAETEPFKGADSELSLKYMGRDMEHGHGVEEIDIKQYFESRDFTINEVLVESNKIYTTEKCIRDTLRGIVRVTDYELNAYGSGKLELGPKMKAKSLRFYVEQLYLTGISEIDYDDKSEIEKSFINPFWLAIQLDRAFERSLIIAEKFTEILHEFQVIPEDIKDSLDLVAYLQSEVSGDFYFRNVPGQVYDLEDQEIENLREGRLSETEYWEQYFEKLNK